MSIYLNKMSKNSKRRKTQKQNFKGKQPVKQEVKKKNNRKISRPLLATGMGVVLILASIFVFDIENGELKLAFAKEKAMSPIGLSDNTPRLTVDQSRIDFGDVRHNTRKLFSFTVSNTGNDNLEFERQPYINVVKGC
ncbi:hypothetical protein KKI24_30680 [bacterium]|nr:hypothetical protein [bacterium]